MYVCMYIVWQQDLDAGTISPPASVRREGVCAKGRADKWEGERVRGLKRDRGEREQGFRETTPFRDRTTSLQKTIYTIFYTIMIYNV